MKNSVEWFPIETIPKDGTKIIAYRNGEVQTCWWRADILGKFCLGGKGWSYPTESEYAPTHWTWEFNKPANVNRGKVDLYEN